MAKVTSIKVRMYRHGFGDCFLLRFLEYDNIVFTMLIDCGLKFQQKIKEVPIEDVVQNLRDELTPEGEKKPKLDVLVASHEHWDHVSAFHPKQKFFDDFIIDQIWLAWTEDPDDEEAKVINSRLRDGVNALAMASEKLKNTQQATIAQQASLLSANALKKGREKFTEQLADVLGFYGSTALTSKGGIKYKEKGKISPDTQVALEHLISLGKKKTSVKFFEPGTMVSQKLLPEGINIYVLGPPKNKWINESDPKKELKKEVYFGMDANGTMGFVNGLLAMHTGNRMADDGRPFGKVQELKGDGSNHPYYRSSYYKRGEEWRKIEHDWLDITGRFALQLDGAINNTSLVLAIEFAGSEKILLFPGDAQVGSWLSWHEHEWEVKRGDKKVKVKAEDLLRNTVLYKVSHHGSHNATVKEKGLEMMKHEELVALIPEKEGSYEGILYDPLLTRLKQMCKGRVIVSADETEPAHKLKDKKLAQQNFPNLSEKERDTFMSNLEVDTLFVEYTVEG